MTMVKKTNQGLQTAVLFAVLVAAVLLFVVKIRQERDITQYSERYVSVSEVTAELGFGVYASEDWDTWFLEFHKDYLTGGILSRLLEKLGVRDYIEPEYAGTEDGQQPGLNRRIFSGQRAVSREEWNLIYRQILDYLDMEREVTTRTFLVLDAMEADSASVLTTDGEDVSTWLPASWFDQWTAYEGYIIEDICVGLVGIYREELPLKNVYLRSCEGGTADFLYGGMTYQKEMQQPEEGLSAGVCDLIFREGAVTSVRIKQDVIKGGLLSYDDTSIEIDGYGKIGHTGRIPVYQTYGEIAEKSLSDVILGNMEADYVTGDNQVCAILIRQPASIENIRVLLLADNGGNFRQEVYLQCSVEATLTCGQTQTPVAADTLVCAADYLPDGAGETLILTPSDAAGAVFVCDASGKQISNGYSGTMEVRKTQEGYTLVNQLPFETYLCAVVPSEMPSSYGIEAQKAQAVCARSYAYIQLLRADLAEFGAHINDSTSYQVYNKVAPTESSVTAVQETAGQVITWQGSPVEAYYFSTSMGYTDTAAVWNVEDENASGYLKPVCLNETPYEGDLSDEAAFLSYITQKADGYDGSVKFSRWFAAADYREKTAELAKILSERRAASAKNIQYFGTDGTTPLADGTDIGALGQLTGMAVTERSASGSILTLELIYEQGRVQVKTEYNIRKVLGCGVSRLVYADGGENTDVVMLPSAFCAVTPQEDGTVLLQGGGYGHGLGMSQNGANGMAAAGMNYEEILHFFYHDITIESY